VQLPPQSSFKGICCCIGGQRTLGPKSAIPRVGPILPALYRPVFAVPPSGDCADRTISWKHNLALSAILWFKSQSPSYRKEIQWHEVSRV
jgi:hypothetical protein